MSGRYKMGTISELTGFKPELLRAWERRYKLLEPVRTEGGHRLYTDDDLLVLRHVRQAVDAGRSIGELAGGGRASLLAEARSASTHRLPARAPQAEDGFPSNLPSLSPAQLDRLPVGIVQVDDVGVVLQYNRFEAEFSGLSREDVVGRAFFTDVAPCSNNPLLYGVFTAGVADDDLDACVDYTFSYRMRPTNVTIRLYRHGSTGTNWVIVAPT